MVAPKQRILPKAVASTGPRVLVGRPGSDSAHPGAIDRIRTLPSEILLRSRTFSDAQWLAARFHLDRIRLWSLPRQASASRSESVHDLPSWIFSHRQRRRLHRHRKPALPELLSPHRRTQLRLGLRPLRVILLV